MKANIFTIAFPFKQKFHYLTINANMIAMSIACNLMGDAMLDVACEHKQFLEYRFKIDGNNYLVTFAYNSPKLLNIYQCSEHQDENESLIEENVPYIIIKVINDKAEIFNISKD